MPLSSASPTLSTAAAGLREYTGIVHLHSTYSDGSWPVERIIGEALRAGLDFLFLTDHDTLQPLTDGLAGWWSPAGDNGPRWTGRRLASGETGRPRLYLGVGAEITPEDSHYLALGIHELPDRRWPSQQVIDRVREQGGTGVIVHPDHRGNQRFGIGCYKWADWSVTGFQLLDLWDLMTDWQDFLRDIPTAYLAYNRPAWVLKGPKPATLDRWDAMLAERPQPMIGCCDNHGRPYRLVRTYEILPYPVALRILRLHILAPPLKGLPPERVETELLAAMRAGRSFIAQDFWWNSRGFRFGAESPSRRALMGETVSPSDGPWRLRVELPSRARITLLRDGRSCRSETTTLLTEDVTGAGVFRVEVHRRRHGRWKPWIYSNAIRIREE